MRLRKTCIYNANIILRDEVVKGIIYIEDDKITRVSEGTLSGDEVDTVIMIDAQEAYVMPGMIDIHSDAIEKEIQPKPNTLFPVEMAFYELEKRLAGSGITTMYHSLSLSDECGVRDTETVLGIIDSINKFKKSRSMIDHRIHLQYELTYQEGLDILRKLVSSRSIDFMSYMDHTPGQGQFKNSDELKRFTMQSYGKKGKEVDDVIEKTLEYQAVIDWSKLKSTAIMARNNGIRLATHGDDTVEKIKTLLECQGVLSEFPINLETAMYAKSQGLYVSVGAPNIVIGISHGNNMRAIDAIKNNAADIICSDYLPSAMLPAVFNITGEGIGLPEAVKMVSLNPAKVLGIDQAVGTIEAGKQADLLIVEMYHEYPVVRKTIAGGRLVYQSDFRKDVLYAFCSDWGYSQ
jgi:alpha-D-ribose 1-methylphosphonate 5-triphosphate diphosphatase